MRLEAHGAGRSIRSHPRSKVEKENYRVVGESTSLEDSHRGKMSDPLLDLSQNELQTRGENESQGLSEELLSSRRG